MADWIDFELVGESPSGKTLIWTVVEKDAGGRLGQVRWYASWRKYAYFPSGGSVYESTCLRDISQFCLEQTMMHKGAKNGNKN